MAVHQFLLMIGLPGGGSRVSPLVRVMFVW